jgi:hypothetical protein
MQLSTAEWRVVTAGNDPDDLNNKPIISDLLTFYLCFSYYKYLEAQLPSFLCVSGVFEDG